MKAPDTEPTDHIEPEISTPKESDTGDAAEAIPESAPSPVELLTAEVQKFKDLAHRTTADFDNYRKRMVREKEEAIRYANTSLLERLLPVLDSFELGIQAAKKTSGSEAILQGFQMVEKQIQDFLKDNGVEPIVSENATFDPNLHEAVSQQHDDTIEEGKVLHQIRRGFKLRDRLLRPSMVIISKGPA